MKDFTQYIEIIFMKIYQNLQLNTNLIVININKVGIVILFTLFTSNSVFFQWSKFQCLFLHHAQQLSVYTQVLWVIYGSAAVNLLLLPSFARGVFTQFEHFHICCDMSFRLIILSLVNSYLFQDAHRLVGIEKTTIKCNIIATLTLIIKDKIKFEYK